MTRFRFGKKIGSGGFGVVSHATRVEDKAPFAAKHLAQDLLTDEEAIKRFRREVRLQRELDHRNILPIVGANLSAVPPWFVMPIAERTLLDEGQAGLGDDDVVRLFRGILAGVFHAHANDVIHRDLKPENVLISHGGEPQLSDFGLGKNLLSDSTAITQTTVGMGSFPYVAPEQMRDARAADERADIFALGKILQFLVTGSLPVVTPDPDVPSKYRYFIAKCCEPLPDERYQTISEVSDAFEQVVRGVERPRPVREIANELIARWGESRESECLRQLLELLEEQSGDALVYRAVVPQLDDDALAAAFGQFPRDITRVLEYYDEHVEGSLDFEYCDVVADFYRRVYAATDDLRIRKMVLTRLLHVGSSHNRYHVGYVVAGLLARARETSEVMMVVDVLETNREQADWFAPNPQLREADLAPPIDEAMYRQKR